MSEAERLVALVLLLILPLLAYNQRLLRHLFEKIRLRLAGVTGPAGRGGSLQPGDITGFWISLGLTVALLLSYWLLMG